MLRLRARIEGGSIRGRMLAALLLLAGVPVIVLGVSLVLVGRTAGDARQIDVAGSLRMSGFVIASQLNSHIANQAEYKRAIVEDEFALMHEALVGLEHGSRVLRVQPVRGAELRARVADARHALELYQGVATRVFDELDRGALPPQRIEAASQEVLGSAYGMLALTLRLAQGLEARASAARRQLWLFQVAAVGVALVVALATLWAVHRFVLGPIPGLLAAFGEVRDGHYGIQVRMPGDHEELADLARGFNTMSAALESTHHELVAKQAEILEKNAALERAGRLKSQFVANMSHELRTPLNAIIGYTKLLRSGVYGAVPAGMHEALQGIDETSKALLTLINDILDVAKIEAGRMDLHLETFRVEDLLGEVEEMLRPLAAGKGLEFCVTSESSLPNVTSDRDKVRRIVVNLAGNAVKFTRRGRVDIALRAADRGWFEIRVRDTGPGIARQHFEAIFEDFRQLDGSATREHGGTGLGLAISRRLARHLGGDIQVASEEGRGSTFTLRLPVFVRVDGGDPAAADPGAGASAAPADRRQEG